MISYGDSHRDPSFSLDKAMIKPHSNSQIDALLVGYERQENLGLRSIMAYLIAHGRQAVLVPFYPDNYGPVLSAVQQFKPRLIGFSLIFQYSINEFGRLMSYLRDSGVTAHFTAGGHFPSLRPEDTLRLIPELDSIVRFEGEATLLELIEHLDHPQQWEGIRGLAFKNGSRTLITEPRPLIANLDSLPLLYRDEPQQTVYGVKMAAMLGSRGCLFNCSFCSIRQFYGASKGSLRRVRSPEALVKEMLLLHTEKNIRFFSFQDDDFAARSPAQRRWVKAFLKELEKSELVGKVGWKISCRVDDLDRETLETMLEHGLVAVYLGVESGNDIGLRTLNKHVSVENNLAAINLLKEYNVAMAIGFMLFDPSSTMDTVRQNIGFLRTIGEDGYFPINFCKMLPYAGTPIEALLRKEGRLKGTVTQPDYGFSDPLLDWYEFLVQRVFFHRNFGQDGIAALLQQADWDCRLARHLALVTPSQDLGRGLNENIRDTNLLAVETLETLLDEILTHDIGFLLKDQERLINIFEQEWRGEMKAEVRLMELFATAGKEMRVEAEAGTALRVDRCGFQ
jgi:anaerobic magnesium-protoporphyrin IX monomethyl ester cyclase